MAPRLSGFCCWIRTRGRSKKISAAARPVNPANRRLEMAGLLYGNQGEAKAGGKSHEARESSARLGIGQDRRARQSAAACAQEVTAQTGTQAGAQGHGQGQSPAARQEQAGAQGRGE